jgi:hypothetical protein
MTETLFARIPPSLVILLFVFGICCRAIYRSLTVGARRRQLIRDHGCQKPYYYPHKGLDGKLFGWDMIRDVMKDLKARRFFPAMRARLYPEGRYTVMFRANFLDSEFEQSNTTLCTDASARVEH